MSSTRRRRCRPAPVIRALTYISGAAVGGLQAFAASPLTPPALPLPCTANVCGAAGPSRFLTSGTATAVASGNSLTVNQISNTAILNWSSFNIGAGAAVVFKQPGSSAIALNRIFQASPSQIFGELSANGQVYLINLNGFVFGKTATVNVGSLLVSSLPLSLSDAKFGNGILSPLQSTQSAAFDASLDPLAPGGRTSVRDANGKPVLDANGNPLQVQIQVQPGAQITVADQGRILLAGQSVTNGGTLTAPDGQVVLAAGQKIYLQADADPALRGLIVEVDGSCNSAGTACNSATNQLTGLLTTPRGNVTMVGLAVNQEGRISATTSVTANGSIRLEAASDVSVGGSVGNYTVTSTQGGALTIGPQSQMQILTDASSGTAVSAQTQLNSNVTLLGEQVLLQGGSIVAPGANLTAIAAKDPANTAAPTSTNPYAVTGITATADPNARLRIDAGTTIDLSGSSASLPVNANLVEAQLRSSELADDPAQRNGALHGQTVFVNLLNGEPPIANLSGEFADVPQTIAQRTEAGGTAIFQSEGDAVFAAGANINVSGGSSTYAGGLLQTSYLVGANGHLYPIATANPLLTYVGVVNPTFTQNFNTWGAQESFPTPGLATYQPGYVQGAPGGKIQFAAPTLVLQGTLEGGAVNGLYQRTPSTAVSGAELVIGIPGGVQASGAPFDFISPAVRLTSTPTPIVVGDDASLPGPLTLDLPASYLTGSGFTNTQIYSNYGVTLPADLPLVLPSGSTLSVTAARVDVLSSITDPNGSLAFLNVTNLGSAGTSAQRQGVFLGDGVTLDVRGLWTNDQLGGATGTVSTAQTWQNGGSITLGTSSLGALLSIGDGVSLLADGGAWLEGNGTKVLGTGGAITLNAGAFDGGLDVAGNVAISAFGVNGATGGSFSLTAPRLQVSAAPGAGTAAEGVWTAAQNVDDSPPSPGAVPTTGAAPAAVAAPGGVFQIYDSLFTDFGFQKVDLTANGLVVPGAATTNVLTVATGTPIDATVRSLLLSPTAAFSPSAPTLTGLAAATTLAPYLAQPESVILSALPTAPGNPVGDVAIETGASITAAATAAGPGSITLQSLGSIVVDGSLRAPGGTVDLHILTPGNYEVGFLPDQRIELGPTGTIDVSGVLVTEPSTQVVNLGKVDAGGTVDLFADRGAVLADAGSLISIAGASAAIAVAQPNGSYGQEVAASAGGTLAVRSGESISLLGGLEAAGGAGGTSGPAAGGSLDLTLSRSESWWKVTTVAANLSFNQGPLTVELEPTVPSTVPPSLANSNQAMLGAAQLSQSGIDALRIESGSQVELSGNFALDLARQIVLDSPVVAAGVGANARLSAPYIEVGNQLLTTATSSNSNPASGGSGSLSFSGAQIELLGSTVFQGTSNLSLVSSGDLQLVGEARSASANVLNGSLTAAGNVSFDAERIYPVTGTSFAIDAIEDPRTGIPGTVTIGQTGANPGTPLSAGGSLSISAYQVNSTGTLYAPFGSISLNASNGLMLGAGSVTSVSGGGLTIPYGSTQFGGEQWLYAFSNQAAVVSGVPNRSISLTAPSVSIAGGATINLGGGGDLQAYEFVPGPGGSLDALASPTATAGAVTPGLYAILPSTRGQAAPQDPQDSDASILPGESVYLSSGGGLAAGTYPLLPARFGLLPGAILIQVESAYQSASAGSLGALANGTPVVAGYLSFGNTGLHETPGYEGFAIYPANYAQQLATYQISDASTFFAAAASTAGAPRPTLPADAGSLSIAVTNSLNADGRVITAAASGGLAAPIQIGAPDIVVGTVTDAPAGAIDLSPTVLSGWQPGSLLLGGTMTTTTTATGATSTPVNSSVLNVLANTVTIGADATLTAGQIILAANQSIEVQSGATLQTTSAAAHTALTTPPAVELVTFQSGNPAFLGLSDLNWLIPERPGSIGDVPAGAASVTLAAGAVLASRGSLTLDGIGGLTVGGTLNGPGAEISLGSSSVAFVPAGGGSADALSITPELVTQLGSASAVRIASTGPIDVLAPDVSLGVGAGGSPTLGSLTLEAASLNNMTGGAVSAFGAKTLTLEGSGAATAAVSAGPPGTTLSLVAGVLDLGPNTLDINGFGATHASVSGGLVGQGTGGINVGGDLSIAGGLTVAAGAATSLNATGTLAVTPAMGGGALPTLLGGTLTLSGNSVNVSGTVSAPAGAVILDATTDLNVAAGALIAAAGIPVTIGNQISAAPGGSITATAGGNLTLSPGATLDVAGAGPAAAGALSLTAGGTLGVGATLMGSAGAGAGGSFSLDAGSLAFAVPSAGNKNPLTLLAAELGPDAAGSGFSNAVSLRVRTGNLDVDAGSSLTANTVSLTADSGDVTVGGQIDAPSGALRGSLSIFGGAGVELLAGGGLHADGAGATGRGGTIEIGAGQLGTGQLIDGQAGLYSYNGGSIALDAGSTISTAGAAGMGTLLLRAPALLTSDSIGITSLASDTSKVGGIIVEPVLVFNTADNTVFTSAAGETAPTSGDFGQVGTLVGQYMSAAVPNITSHLVPSSGTPLLVEAGVEIVAPGALTLPALDLSANNGSNNGLSWQFNGAPVDFTVRAAGSITVAGTISDGFNVQNVGDSFGVTQPTLISGASASIRLIAGADVTSANPLAVMADASPTAPALTIDPGVFVRTGTGDLDLMAAGNIVISGPGSGAYTAGVPAVSPGGTASDPYPGVNPLLGTTAPTTDVNGNPIPYGVFVPGTDVLMSFPAGGGNLLVQAGGNIENVPQGNASAAPGGVTNWQIREGNGAANAVVPNATPAEWGVNLVAYNWNFGTLGGGDLRISAGGSVTNVSAAAADSLLPQAFGATPAYIRGGGLSITAGGDIGSGQVFVADGTGTVSAGGAFTATLPSALANQPAVGSAFYLQDSVIDVTARRDVVIDGAFNATALTQPMGTGASSPLFGDFYSYGNDSALNILSVSGDIDLGTQGSALQTLFGTQLNTANSSVASRNTFPATLSLESLTGSIVMGPKIGGGGSIALYPSPIGQLDLLAAGNIMGNVQGGIVMSDPAAGTIATVNSPQGSLALSGFSGNIHGADPNPALVTAGGSIEELGLSIPKSAQIVAGQDIQDLTYFGQNFNTTDQTVFLAGRDFSYSNAYTGSGTSVGGPGQLDVLAGRNIALGFSQGIVTTGNLLNANLPTAQGADLTLVTGLGTAPNIVGTAAAPGFVDTVIAPSTTYQAELVSYVESLQGTSNLSFASAEAAFKALPQRQQLPFVDIVFFNELSESGLAANTVPGAGFTQGYAAIDALFPDSRSSQPDFAAGAFAGNLTLEFSRIYTLSGGGINLVVPGGEINVGLANPPKNISNRAPSTLGIVTEGEGDIDIYTRGDVNVNSSRIFTLGGGNILIWSNEGSIDAGLGAKTSVSAPPPSILISSNGTVTLDFSGAATGSGIRTIQTEPTTPPGDVDLVAPVGTVNAGDAGIGAAGNINIAARQVIGATNINFGGTATGVPAQVSNVSASLAGASNAGSGATNTATNTAAGENAEKEAAAPLAQTALSWLDVFVTGLGEENCKPEDVECLKRQKTPTR